MQAILRWLPAALLLALFGLFWATATQQQFTKRNFGQTALKRLPRER